MRGLREASFYPAPSRSSFPGGSLLSYPRVEYISVSTVSTVSTVQTILLHQGPTQYQTVGVITSTNEQAVSHNNNQ